jgi:light-regulated signal transduction histidine kinase (bacteriophytochrome)
VSNLRVAMEESSAVLTQDSLPTVYSDEGLLGLVFQNLIGNALKFRSPQRPPHVHAHAQRYGMYWMFAVEDNGIGFDPQHAERIFQVFQRLHGGNEYPGTGIGLAICKKIIQQHGGWIWAKSELGKGSTFFFTLPAMKEAITRAERVMSLEL